MRLYPPVALSLDSGPAGSGDHGCYATPVRKALIGGIDDGVSVQGGDVSFDQLDRSAIDAYSHSVPSIRRSSTTAVTCFVLRQGTSLGLPRENPDS
jgi:hypothetical protein